MQPKAKLMDEAAVRRALTRISHEILEKNRGVGDVCLVGVLRRGKALAEAIRDNLRAIEGVEVPCASIDIHFYRDDLTRETEAPVVSGGELPFSVVGKKVILVDDVLYTGRTVRAAIEAIFAQGRPESIELAILIDRGHRQLPFRADFVGKNIPTAKSERVEVLIPPYDGETGVFLYE